MHSYSNLWYVKYTFKLSIMNNKDLYVKYVYHHIHGDFYATSMNQRHFHLDFPRVHSLFVHDYATKVDILFRSHIPTTIWKDKHGNIIVRMLQPNIQTKIDF